MSYETVGALADALKNLRKDDVEVSFLDSVTAEEYVVQRVEYDPDNGRVYIIAE